MMNDLIVPVNNEALARAMVAVAGEENAALIAKAYNMVDSAMAFGHAKGFAEGTDVLASATTRADMDGFERGFKAAQAGEDEKDIAFDEAYDFGFQAGAKEARQNLQAITAEEAEEHFEAGEISGRAAGFTAGYEQAKMYGASLNYDDGYVDGVSDARVFPADADRRVRELCGVDAHDQQDLFEDEETFYSVDDGQTYSGDEECGDDGIWCEYPDCPVCDADEEDDETYDAIHEMNNRFA